MNTIRTITAAAVVGLVATSAIAGEYSKSGPAMAEPMVPVLQAPSVAQRFNWTGAYAGAAIGYGQMNISGFNNRKQAVGGLFGGYRYDTGNAVVGAELIVAPTTFGKAVLPNGDEITSGGSLLFTAGMPVSADARTLAYAGVGPTIMRTSGVGGSKTSTGASVVLGVDRMVTDTVMVRGGITYTGINNLSNASYKTRTLSVGVGIGFKF